MHSSLAITGILVRRSRSCRWHRRSRMRRKEAGEQNIGYGGVARCGGSAGFDNRVLVINRLRPPASQKSRRA